MQKAISMQVSREIISLRDSGKKVTEIMLECGVSKTTVYRHFKMESEGIGIYDPKLEYPSQSSNEIWRGIPGSDSLVSNLGRVTGQTGYILSPAKTATFFLGVRIVVDGELITHLIHQLVCRAFHGPKPIGDYVVDHINGDQHDNRASNLRWLTRRENFLNLHPFNYSREELQEMVKKEASERSKRSVNQSSITDGSANPDAKNNEDSYEVQNEKR